MHELETDVEIAIRQTLTAVGAVLFMTALTVWMFLKF